MFANAGIVSANFTDYRNQSSTPIPGYLDGAACVNGCANVSMPNTPTPNMNFGLLYKLNLAGC